MKCRESDEGGGVKRENGNGRQKNERRSNNVTKVKEMRENTSNRCFNVRVLSEGKQNTPKMMDIRNSYIQH